MITTETGGFPSVCGALPGANLADDMLRGADAIAEFMGMRRRQIYHLAEVCRLPVFKMGAVLCARKSKLLAWIEVQEQLATEA